MVYCHTALPDNGLATLARHNSKRPLLTLHRYRVSRNCGISHNTFSRWIPSPVFSLSTVYPETLPHDCPILQNRFRIHPRLIIWLITSRVISESAAFRWKFIVCAVPSEPPQQPHAAFLHAAIAIVWPACLPATQYINISCQFSLYIT